MLVLLGAIFYFLISEGAALNVNNTQNRIYKGVAAKERQYPFMVIILTGYNRRKKSSCSGSLIKLDTILTAAHCLHEKQPYYEYKPINVVVAVGRTVVVDYAAFRFQNPMNVQFPGRKDILQESIASQLFMHPYYKMHNNFDIGIIKIAKPFMLTKYVGTIKFTTEKYNGATTCYVLGYGLDHYEFFGTLYFYTTQKIKSNMKDCGEPPNPLLYCHKVLSMSEPGPCEGDSGGPMLCKGKVYGVYMGDVEFTKINPNISECGQPFIKTFVSLSFSEQGQNFVSKFAELLESKSCKNVPLHNLFLLLSSLLLLYDKFEL